MQILVQRRETKGYSRHLYQQGSSLRTLTLMQVYDSMFLGKIKNESWLATNVIYSSYPLLPNIRTLVDNCGFGPPVHDIAENSNITIEVGTIDAWEIESQKIASISTYTGVGTTSVFPNCVALHIKKICEPKGILDLKRFPALTVLDCVHDSYQSLDVVGDTSQLKEVILGRFGPLSLNQVATAVYGTTNIGEPSRIKRLEKIDMSGNSNFNFFTDVAYFKNLVTLSCSRVNRDVLAQLHNLRFLTVSFRDIYSKSIPDPFKHIPPLPNLEQLCMKLDMRLDMWGPVQHYIRRVRLPPWLATMRKLNKLSIDSEIINPEFIPRKLFFIQELVVHHRTRTILESFVCDIGIPILRNMFKFSSV